VNVADWAETSWRLPTGELIQLRPWQRATLLAMFPADGSLSPWETFLVSTVKKAGKTTLNAVATLYAALTFPAPETVYVVANDEAQAQERVFDMVAGAVRRMGLVKSGAAVASKGEIVFPETGSRIVAIPADFAGAAGANFGVSSWTELWAFRHEGHVRLWEELTPVPLRRSLRIVDSYAGFTGDAPILEPMWQRALAGERLDDELPIFAAGRLWAFIDAGEEAQRRAWRGADAEREAYYGEQAATLRPGTFARLHLNAWQSGEEAFLTAEDWDGCVSADLTPLLPSKAVTVHVGVDAATKHDSAAVVAVARVDGRLRLAAHRIWTPRKGETLDLEETIEAYLLQLHAGFRIAAVRYDPMQMVRSAATLRKAGLPMVEFPQTSANLTAAGQSLYELVRSRNLELYPDDELRRHALNAVAVDSGRGWRLAKEKSSRKIDGVAGLSFAALDAIENAGGSGGGVAGIIEHGGLLMGRDRERELYRDPRGDEPAAEADEPDEGDEWRADGTLIQRLPPRLDVGRPGRGDPRGECWACGATCGARSKLCPECAFAPARRARERLARVETGPA
jgi:phage terminase large subunit-like protein